MLFRSAHGHQDRHPSPNDETTIAWGAGRALMRLRGDGRLVIRRRVPILIIVAIATASFALALKGATSDGGSWLIHFYSPLTRAWEFAAGALVALLLPYARRAHGVLTTLFGIVGFALVLVGFWAVSGDAHWPGIATVLPVAGTALLIAAGSGSANAVSRALSIRPMVLIGDWSYSLYLWH